MKRVLFDMNVVLDVLLDRKPFADQSATAWAAIESGIAEGFLSAHAVTTIYYFVQKDRGGNYARRIISALLTVFDIAAVDQPVIQEAMRSTLADFEDSVTSTAARHAGCDYIVTRDLKGFRGSPVPPVAPAAVISLL